VSKRLLDLLAPVRPSRGDRGYRRALRWAAVPVTDRRWAAPLCAAALGFGIFAGVAIGPGASGTFATGVPPVIELPGLLEEGEGEGGETAEAGEAGGEAFEGGGGEESGEAFPEEAGTAFETGFPEETAPEKTAGPSPPAEEAPHGEPDPEEPEQTIAGVVVHANPAAGSYTVVESGGLPNAIHAAKLPAPGTKVSVPVRTLANGTFAEDGKRKQAGKRTSATVAGIVTFVGADPAAPAYTISKRGVSMLIRVHPDPTGSAPALPQLGAYATVSVEIEKPPTGAGPPAAAPAPGEAAVMPAPPAEPACAADPAQPVAVPSAPAILWQQTIDADGAPFASSDFAGVVTAICPDEAKLALSGDDLRQSGADVVFAVPKSIDLGRLKVGDSVATTAAIEADDALRLTGLASDERTKGADDAAAAQGDLASQTPR
jgi:hypothetical protein